MLQRSKIGIFCATWAIFSCGNLLAETSNPALPPGIVKSMAYYGQSKGFRCTFQQTKIIKDLGVTIESSGKMSVDFEGTLQWNVEKPAPLSIKMTDRDIEIQEPQKPTQTIKMDDQSLASTVTNEVTAFLALFKMDGALWQKQFDINDLGKSHYRLTPRRSQMIQWIVLTTGKEGQVTRAHIKEKSNDEIKIEFSDPVFNSGS